MLLTLNPWWKGLLASALPTLVTDGKTFGRTGLTQRLLLYQGELWRVPSGYHGLRVVAGVAFVTQAGRDHIVHPGSVAPLLRGGDVALVSPLGSDCLIVELYGRRSGY